MRHWVIVAGVLLALGGSTFTVPARAAPPADRCQADASFLRASGAVQTRAVPYFVEVELTLQNKTETGIRVDPSRFTLVPDQGDPVFPATPDQVVYALAGSGSPTVGFVGFWGGWGGWRSSFGIAVGGTVPLNVPARTIEARILRGGELAPGASVKGSIYFKPASWPARFTLVLDGLTLSSGQGYQPVELRNCQMSFRPSEPPVAAVPPPPGARTLVLNARAEAGPVVVNVSRAEFTRQATTLTVVVENSAGEDADLFVAIGQARLVDSAGSAYAVRMLRSDLPDRVGARSQGQGRLVFEPLPIPPAVTSAVLTIPGVRVAAETYDLRLDLRF
jgi:hypothetical protein